MIQSCFKFEVSNFSPTKVQSTPRIHFHIFELESVRYFFLSASNMESTTDIHGVVLLGSISSKGHMHLYQQKKNFFEKAHKFTQLIARGFTSTLAGCAV